MISLKLVNGPQAGRSFSFSGDRPFAVGRQSHDLLLPDMLSSRQHAQLAFQNNLWLLTDLDSSNGTYLNGARITTFTEIHVGDTIRIGATEIHVETLNNDPLPKTAPENPSPRNNDSAQHSDDEPFFPHRPHAPSHRPQPQPMTKDEALDKLLSMQPVTEHSRPVVRVAHPTRGETDFDDAAMNEQTIAGFTLSPPGSASGSSLENIPPNSDAPSSNIITKESLRPDESDHLPTAVLNDVDQTALELSELLEPLPASHASPPPHRKPSFIRRTFRTLMILIVFAAFVCLAWTSWQVYELRQSQLTTPSPGNNPTTENKPISSTPANQKSDPPAKNKSAQTSEKQVDPAIAPKTNSATKEPAKSSTPKPKQEDIPSKPSTSSTTKSSSQPQSPDTSSSDAADSLLDLPVH
ncbi:FHA domain-containing protein [Poriferisphaera sp. WC338]|uniref:FHA domain-containing protein n=1 Tax=Poriferisphaera sp. WC338 TaxID=3425129 RepID=UPI003D81826F